MPSLASCSILRIAQFQSPVSWKSHVWSCPSWDALRRSFSCLWIILYSFLVLDVLFDDFQRRTAHGGDKIGVRPQRGQSRLEPGIFLTQEPRRTALDLAYQAMNAVLRIDFHQEMHVIGHDFQLEQLCMRFGADTLYNIFKPGIHSSDQDATTILRTPHNVVFAGVDNVIIRFVADGI